MDSDLKAWKCFNFIFTIFLVNWRLQVRRYFALDGISRFCIILKMLIIDGIVAAVMLGGKLERIIGCALSNSIVET